MITLERHILVVDDEEDLCYLLEKVLRREGYQVAYATSGEAALEHLESNRPRLIITDLRMPGIDGLELLRRVKVTLGDVTVLVMTAHGTVDTAVEAMKLGAFDYLTKPFKLDEIKLVVRRALEREAAQAAGVPVRADAAPEGLAGMVGNGEKMEELFRLVRQAAPSEAGILIRGETGTGKELVARAIHLASPRRGGPFVKVNCAALPESLLESELFGHEKGSFTGAANRRPGRFELAGGGTLFLDEIGDIPSSTQVRLLRVLQEKEFERVGGAQTIEADVRIVSATHRNLEKAVQEGAFREDLYYRLNVIPLYLPPLRERRDDIPPLIDHFLRRYDPSGNKKLTPETVTRLSRYDWPGNVRELENLIQRLVVLSTTDVIKSSDLPILFQAVRETRSEVSRPVAAVVGGVGTPAPVPGDYDAGRLPSGLTMQEMERLLILQTLDETNGKRTLAASRLGISLRTLQYKLKEYGVDRN